MKFILAFLLWLSTSAFTSIEPTVQSVDHRRITSEYNCIVQMLYHEARGMKNRDIDDVLSVAYNRTNSSIYPSSYCKVIYQKNQYSFTRRAYQKPIGTLTSDLKQHGNTYVLEAVFKAATGSFKPSLQHDILWYHTAGYSVGWNMKKIEKVKTIGKSQHIFYKQVNL